MKSPDTIATARNGSPASPSGRPRTAGLCGAALALATLAAGVAPGAAGAWTPEVHAEIARQAATIAPPDLFGQIKRHEKEFSAGISASLRGRNHADAGDALLSRVRAGSISIVGAIEAHEPFRDIVRELGRLGVYAAEANNPLRFPNGDGSVGSYRSDYETYVTSALPRFEPVFYGEGRDVRTEAGLVRLLSETGRRGAELFPLLGLEYRRIGSIDGVRLFDDKSTAFGIGSIAFSHAVSDVAAIYRYIWLRAGGGDPRVLPVTRPAASDPGSRARAEGPGGVRGR